MTEFFETVIGWMEARLFVIDGKPVTLSGILIGIGILIVAFIVSKIVRTFLGAQLLKRVKLSTGVSYAILRFVHYFIVIIGALIAVQTVGINLNSITIVLGFLSVGIGFGLQNVTSNFISGLILLIERPVSVGDMVRVGDQTGSVSEIRMRSTLINTLDNVTIIVPNSQLIENEVVNWSHGDTRVRIHAHVGVAYGSDMESVRSVLLHVAENHPEILPDPAPRVHFLEFGDSSLNMDLLVWIARPQDQFRVLSELNFAIDKGFREAGVEIPFPQRDFNLRINAGLNQLTQSLQRD